MISLRWKVWYSFSGEIIPAEKDLIQYVQSKMRNLNTIKIIDDFSFIENTISSFENSRLPDSEIDRNMINITGCSDAEYKKYLSNNHTSSIEFWKIYVNNNKNKIKVRLLTALLYYGTEEEKGRALKKLREITHKDFSNAKEWLQWYRYQNWTLKQNEGIVHPAFNKTLNRKLPGGA